MYLAHERKKKTKHLQKVIETEKVSFTPFVISITGGMVPEAEAFFQRLSSLTETIIKGRPVIFDHSWIPS